MDTESLTETICRLIKNNYDLGHLNHVEEIFGGYCNKSYAISIVNENKKCRYFLRLYNSNTSENEILFEHSLLNHLRSNGLTLSASLIPCRNGATVSHAQSLDNQQNSRLFSAIFAFLEGEDTYSWTYNKLTDKEFVSSAEVLAHFHHCGHGFKKPFGADRVQPRIMALIPTFKNTFSSLLKHAGDGQCDRQFKDNFNTICNTLDYAVTFDVKFKGMKELPIHCDYHPGNLKYGDEKVVGLFDFDWAKVDYRLFDVALGLIYFTSIWGGQAKKGLRKDTLRLFLSTYNQTCCQLIHIYPLTKQEQSYLVPMLSIANLYVLHWELINFYNTPGLNDDEYFLYIDHTIGLMHWLLRNEDEIEFWVDTI